MGKCCSRIICPPYPSLGGVRVSAIPSLIPSLILDLDAHYGVGLAGSDVATWADGSGAGNNFSDGTNRPVYSAADINWGNRPSIAYAAAGNDRLSATTAAATWVALHNGSGASFGIVFRSTVTGVSQRLAGTANAAGNTGALIQLNANQSIDYRIRNGVVGDAYNGPTTPTVLGSRNVAVFTYNTAGLRTYLNGLLTAVAVPPIVPSAGNPTATLRIGLGTSGTNPVTGEINAVHVWNRILDVDEVATYSAWARVNWLES